MFFLGKRIFEPVMHVDNDIGEWNLAWIASGIQISDMIYLAVQYWLSKPLTLTVVTEMLNFHRVIDTICNTDGNIVTFFIFSYQKKLFLFLFQGSDLIGKELKISFQIVQIHLHV